MDIQPHGGTDVAKGGLQAFCPEMRALGLLTSFGALDMILSLVRRNAVSIILVLAGLHLSVLPVLAGTAGFTGVGSAVLPNSSFTEAGTIDLGGEFPTASAIDPAGNFLVVATSGARQRILKLDISSGTAAPILADIQLDEQDAYPVSLLIDPSGTYAYLILTEYVSQIVKIRLSDFTRVATLVLPESDGPIYFGAMDPAGGFAYFANQAMIIKVNLASFTRVDDLTLPAGEDDMSCLAIGASGQFAYAGTFNAPAKVIKINLGTFSRVSSITLPAGEHNLNTILIDPSESFLYFSCYVTPVVVVRVNLSNFQRAGSISLAANEQRPMEAAMDPTGAFAYYGVNPDINNVSVVKLDLGTFTRLNAQQLGTGNFDLNSFDIHPSGTAAWCGTRTGLSIGTIYRLNLVNSTNVPALTLPKPADLPRAGVIDPVTRRMLVVNASSDPAQLVEVDPVTMLRMRSLTFAADEKTATVVQVNPVKRRAYVGFDMNPPKLVEVNLDTFAREREVTFNSAYQGLRAGAVDPQGENLFVILDTPTNPPDSSLEQVYLSTFTRNPSTIPFTDGLEPWVYINPAGSELFVARKGSPVSILRFGIPFNFTGIQALASGENSVPCMTPDVTEQFLYLGCNTSPPRVIKFNVNSLSRESALTLQADDGPLLSAATDPAGRYAYFLRNTPGDDIGRVIRVDLENFTRVNDLNNLGLIIRYAIQIVMEPNGHYLLCVLPLGNGTIAKVSLDSSNVARAIRFTLTQPSVVQSAHFYAHVPVQMRREDSQLFDLSQFTPKCSVLDNNGNGYFGTGTYPGQVVRFNLSTLERTGELTLPAGEDDLSCAVVDSTREFAYFGCFTSPGKIVKVRLSDLSRVSVLTLQPGEDNLSSAVLDPSGQFAYFGTSSSEGMVIKVRLADFTRVGSIQFQEGEGPLRCAIAAGTNAWFGIYGTPGKVVRVNLSTFQRAGALTLNAGEDFLRCAVADPSGTFGYFGTDTFPGKVVKIRLSDSTRRNVLTLGAEESSVATASMDPNEGFAVFGASSGQVVKVHLGTFTRTETTNLLFNEGSPLSALIDSTGRTVWISSEANPSRLVKVNVLPRPLRLAIYGERNNRRILEWQSGTIRVLNANQWITANISAGTPNSLLLQPGNYYLAWQLDSDLTVASHTMGNTGDGASFGMSFGPFPLMPSIFTWEATDDLWSTYITYAIQTRAKKWEQYE